MREQMHVRIVPMTGDHLDEVAELERICFTTPWSRNMLVEELQNDCAAFLVALQPEKLTGRLGKFLCPMLLLLVGAMFVGSLVHPVGTYGPTLPPYDQIPAVQGFLTGYQTMDTIAALNFGIVIVMNIRALGVTDQGSVLRATVRAGGIATVLFLAVYSMLAHIGALSGAAFPGMTNGAVTLTNLVGAIFGHWGTVILAAIFFIACFNTCVGLISSCSAYFHTLVPRVPAHLCHLTTSAYSFSVNIFTIDLLNPGSNAAMDALSLLPVAMPNSALVP